MKILQIDPVSHWCEIERVVRARVRDHWTVFFNRDGELDLFYRVLFIYFLEHFRLLPLFMGLGFERRSFATMLHWLENTDSLRSSSILRFSVTITRTHFIAGIQTWFLLE